MAAADGTSHAEARLAKPSQASQSREGLTNGIGYFCEGRGQARGLTTGCGSGYIQFVTGPVDRPTRGRDAANPAALMNPDAEEVADGWRADLRSLSLP